MPDEGKLQSGSGELSPGTTLLGVYEILGYLGGGGMGRVYRAQHNQLGVLRAIKVIRPDLTAGSTVKQQFIREARVLMEINHDAVARCHELLSDADGCLYLVMELVEGPSLETLIQTGPLDTAAVRALWQRIAEGLVAIHAKGIVHRDISPGNIVLPDGKPDRAKLIDFGVASLAAAETIGMGEFKGKLAYASPEQLGQYGGKIEGKSDIYTFGLVLAEAASGNKVYRTPYETRIPANVPAELREDILRLIEPDPAIRPDNAFPAPAKVVKAPARTEPIRGVAPKTVPPAAPPTEARRSGVGVGTIALIALLLCAAGMGAWLYLRNRTTEGDKPTVASALPPRSDVTKEVTKKDAPPASPPAATVEPPKNAVAEPPSAAPPKTQQAAKSEPVKNPPASTPKTLVAKNDPPKSPAAVSLPVSAVTPAAPPVTKKGPQVGDFKVNPRDGLKYMWIPAGAFLMGCSPGDTECNDDEKPAHPVTISKAFYLGQTDVTQGAYGRVTGTDPSGFKGDNLPVETVTWAMAQGYCQAIGGRLPTEAEWEYAARAGSTTPRYGRLEDIAWFSGNAGNRTHDVAQKQPNAFRLYDMLGNVYQWTADWYGDAYYQMGVSRDPTGLPSGAERTLRGGSWFYPAKQARASYRHRFEPGAHTNKIGFRCAEN